VSYHNINLLSIARKIFELLLNVAVIWRVDVIVAFVKKSTSRDEDSVSIRELVCYKCCSCSV